MGLVSPKKLFEIFDKADHDHDGGSCQTDEEKDFKEARQENSQDHGKIISVQALRKRKGTGVKL